MQSALALTSNSMFTPDFISATRVGKTRVNGGLNGSKQGQWGKVGKGGKHEVRGQGEGTYAIVPSFNVTNIAVCLLSIY